jgi:hypothetical protein
LRRRRRLLAVLVVSLVSLALYYLFPYGGESGLPQHEDLRQLVDAFVASFPSTYTAPRQEELEVFAGLFPERVCDLPTKDASEALGKVGYSVSEFRDSGAAGTPLLRVVEPASRADEDHPWGLFVVDCRHRSGPVVEVPHPLADVKTEDVGVDAFRAGNAAVLMVAGTDRNLMDPAHVSTSVFQTVNDAYVTPGRVIVQLHGFDAAEHSGVGDVILSSGTTQPPAMLEDIRDRLVGVGFSVCLYAMAHDCSDLGGTENVQGASARPTAQFVHVEMSCETRVINAELLARALFDQPSSGTPMREGDAEC